LLTVAGLHVPVTPLLDVVGNAGTVDPIQMEALVPKLKVGVSIGFTVTVNVCVVAHTPAVGVKVYVPLAVLLTVAGLQVPVTPLSDVVGNCGTTPPLQILSVVPKLKVGTVFGTTVTVKVVAVAHSPAFGVNVYVLLAVLLTVAGLHVPLMPFTERVGKTGAVPKLNVGVSIGLTVTVNVVGTAHKPAVGVNVYVPFAVLSIVDGLHVPVMPLVDVVGNAGAVAPLQILKVVPKLNVGVIFGLTVTVNVCVVAHWPAVGVNV
jgi:phosphate starvation-inducible membrane PsiE